MDKITIKCFACEAEHTISIHNAKKLDYYTCDTYECMCPVSPRYGCKLF